MEDSKIWIINIVTTGGLGAIILWVIKGLLKSFITSFENRLKLVEEKGDEIEQNYNEKFKSVNSKIENAAEMQTRKLDNAVDRITSRLDERERVSAEHRERQSNQIAKLEAKMDNVIEVLRDSNRSNKP